MPCPRPRAMLRHPRTASLAPFVLSSATSRNRHEAAQPHRLPAASSIHPATASAHDANQPEPRDSSIGIVAEPRVRGRHFLADLETRLIVGCKLGAGKDRFPLRPVARRPQPVTWHDAYLERAALRRVPLEV